MKLFDDNLNRQATEILIVSFFIQRKRIYLATLNDFTAVISAIDYDT